MEEVWSESTLFAWTDLSQYMKSLQYLFTDDIWLISQQLDFNPKCTFFAKSTYYGPSSSDEVEIEPIAGYSPSNWNKNGTYTLIHEEQLLYLFGYKTGFSPL